MYCVRIDSVLSAIHIHSRLPLCRIAEMVVMTMDMVAVIHLRKCRDFSGKCKIPARKIVSGCLFSGFPARIPEGIVRLSAAARPFPGPAAACGLFRPVRPPFGFLRRSDRDVPDDFPCRAFGNKETFSYLCLRKIPIPIFIWQIYVT